MLSRQIGRVALKCSRGVLLVSHCDHWIDLNGSPRWNVTGEEERYASVLFDCQDEESSSGRWPVGR